MLFLGGERLVNRKVVRMYVVYYIGGDFRERNVGSDWGRSR